jgi:hypothetical protein
MAGWAMIRYERVVHGISIVWRQQAAKRRALKSLSGIARRVSESADTRRGRLADRPARRRSGGCVPTNEPGAAGVA